MTSKREEVARAMIKPLGYEHHREDWARIYVGDITEDGSLKDLCFALADAALAAILPPNEKMIEAGVDSGPVGCCIATGAEVTTIFTAMIGAAGRGE